MGESRNVCGLGKFAEELAAAVVGQPRGSFQRAKEELWAGSVPVAEGHKTAGHPRAVLARNQSSAPGAFCHALEW